jgi:hypothetical protein
MVPRSSQLQQLKSFSSKLSTSSTSPAASVNPVSQKDGPSSSSSSSSLSSGKKMKKHPAVEEVPSAGQLFLHAGLPLVIFSLLAAWVLKNSIEGKNKEYDASKGKVSK